MDIKIPKPELINIDELKKHEYNVKEHPDTQIQDLMKLIKMVGFKDPIVIDKDKKIWAGHGRLEAAVRLHMVSVPCIYLENLTESQKRLFMYMDNKSNESAWIDDNVRIILEDIPGIELEEFSVNFEDILSDEAAIEYNLLSEKFGAPPLTILDSRQAYWRDRRSYWMSLGLKSELGREVGAYDVQHIANTKKYNKGAISDQSIFDPVLTEILVNWFSDANDKVLDPFAGGSVRGIIAGLLNRKYCGVDISERQNTQNQKQVQDIFPKVPGPKIAPEWKTGSAQNLRNIYPNEKFDYILTCPPYHDLEKYSEDPNDLSNMDYEDFVESLHNIISLCCNSLNDDKFASVVMGDIRDNKGFYRNLVMDTINGFAKSGVKLYNHLILVNSFGTAPIRTAMIFPRKRKTIKVHQDVLVFYKGDPNNIKIFEGYLPPDDEI